MKSHVILVVFLALVVQASGHALLRVFQNPLALGQLASTVTDQVLTPRRSNLLTSSHTTANGYFPGNQQFNFVGGGDQAMVQSIGSAVANLVNIINGGMNQASPILGDLENNALFDRAPSNTYNNYPFRSTAVQNQHHHALRHLY